MVIYDRNEQERLLEWAAKVQKIDRFHPDAKALGVVRGGRLRGVVVYDVFTPADCRMHSASDGSRRWLSLEALIRFFAYPFIQCGLRRVTAVVPATNAHALTFNRKLGFQYEGYCPKAFPDDDAVIMGMTRDRCRFIPPEYRHV